MYKLIVSSLYLLILIGIGKLYHLSTLDITVIVTVICGLLVVIESILRFELDKRGLK